jgi:acetyl esterase
VVLSLHYRHAPEHKLPAAHDDAIAAYRWAMLNARSLGADPRRVAVAGERAGGNLAITVAIAARDIGLAAPRYMALIYPVAGTDTDTLSCR